MNDAEVSSIAKAKDSKYYNIGENLYLKPLKSGKASWIFRYTYAKERKEIVLGRYGKAPQGISLKKARELAADNASKVRDGIDPKLERKQTKKQTVDNVAQEWLKERRRNIQNPEIPERVYRRDIQPFIGSLAVDSVTTRDIYDLVQRINNSGRPTIANDALDHCKHIFTQAIILNLIKNNPASILKPKHAGGTEDSRTRNLQFSEIKIALEVMRLNQNQFTRDNYIAVCLLLALGVRKSELIAAKWNEFNLEEKLWMLPEARTKQKAPGLVIALPDKIIPLLEELKVRACNSEYIFPARRSSKRRGYISNDTLNHALGTLFGIPSSAQKKKGISELPNLMKEAGIEEAFTIHDLRRTCRSRLAQLKVPSNVAEKCINHKIKGVEGVYDQWGYFDERKEALQLLSEKLCEMW